MSDYAIYDPLTGEVFTTGSCPSEEDCALQVENYPGSLVLLESVDGDTHYVNNGVAAARPALDVLAEYQITADEVSEVSFPLPDQTLIRFDGQEFTSDGSAFSFTTDTAGEYVFDFIPPFPYQPQRVTINAI